MKKVPESARFLARKRELYRLHRLRLGRRYTGQENVDWTPYASSLVTLLSHEPPGNIRKQQQHLSVKIPPVFSIIDNPEGSLLTIRNLAAALRNSKVSWINFNHADMTEVDLAAETLLDILAVEIKKEAKIRRDPLNFAGTLPPDAYLTRYLRGVGIIKNLEVKHEYLPAREEEELRVLRARNRGEQSEASLIGADYKERTVASFIEHIESCLDTSGRTIRMDQKRRLAEYTGEILNNVEEHSGSNEWTIGGYLDTAHPEHLCEIAIINLGLTIAESFHNLEPDDRAFKTVSPYLDAHRKKKLFRPEWKEDDLLTLVALQGHVSSKASEAVDRGQGTVDLIEFFQEMHRENSGSTLSKCRMAIMSGKTHILFDGNYAMAEDSTGRKVIAFNSNNSLAERPDKEYVTSLSVGFPGTIISIRFPTMTTEENTNVEK